MVSTLPSGSSHCIEWDTRKRAAKPANGLGVKAPSGIVALAAPLAGHAGKVGFYRSCSSVK